MSIAMKSLGCKILRNEQALDVADQKCLTNLGNNDVNQNILATYLPTLVSTDRDLGGDHCKLRGMQMEVVMEVNTVPSMKENNGQETYPPRRPKFGRRLSSSCETPRATNTKKFTFDEVTSLPSLEASLDCSSASGLAEERYESSNSRPLETSVLQQTVASPPSPTDEGCMTDRVVRFFCPFDTIQEAPAPVTRAVNTNSQQSRQSTSYGTSCSTANQDCSGEWAPVQICIPQQWDSSPERSSVSGKRLNIRNRCSTMDAKQRKSKYIEQIREEWHSNNDEAALPFRSSRSAAVAPPKSRPPISIRVPSNPEVFYDSDPEIASSAPTSRYKRNRPTSLNLDAMRAEPSVFECPSVPRHSEQELNSFFNSASPKSVATETPDFNDDAAVRKYIQVATEQRVSLVWHQAPISHEEGFSKSKTHSHSAPKSITGWFESGSQLDNLVVFPKFVWRQAFRSGTSLISRTPHHIQLLTIVGVVTPASLDRNLYPFARLDRSCLIQTHDGKEYVFEASCGQERDLFVKRLKVLVARLASSVIVHDENMLKEFFSPAGSESFADNLSVDCQSNEDSASKPSLPQSMDMSVEII